MNHNQKAKQNSLIQTSEGNFGTSYSYRGEDNRPIEDFFKKDFFETVKTRLVPSDTIRVIEMKNGKVTASILMIVISRSKKDLDLDIRPYDNAEIIRYSDEPVIEPTPEEDFPDVKYITGSGQVEQDRVTKMYQIKCDGKVVCETEKKGLAMAIARGDAPIPQS